MQNIQVRLYKMLMIGAGALWLVVFGLGEISTSTSTALMSNQRCLAFFGCNVGFFGYDALEHFLMGVLQIFIILFVSAAYPRCNTLAETKLKRALVLLAYAALIAFLWELGEYSFDALRLRIFHEQLVHPNLLWQSSDSDTMGDMTFAFLGSLLASLASFAVFPRSRESPGS
jgi:hypothetical protein